MSTAPFTVLIPLFNDWESLSLLLPMLDLVLQRERLAVDILVVDDASTLPPPTNLLATSLSSITRIEVLRLRRNLGHQRAVAIGLAFIEARGGSPGVVVMDGDGEDRPVDVPRLVERLRLEGGTKIVFAERRRRSEGFIFGVFYRLYRVSHRLLVGLGVRVGNFSAVPPPALATLVACSELWNHYAAAVFKVKFPFCTIPTERGERLAGRSHMNFVALVAHGLSAFSVYGDVIGVRLLVATMMLIVLGATGLIATVVIRMSTQLAIPGWATYASGISLLLFVESALIALVFVFIILGSRGNLTFLPLRDYKFFVGDVRTVWSVDAQESLSDESRYRAPAGSPPGSARPLP